MQLEIGKSFLYLLMAKKVFDVVSWAYLKKWNATHIDELKTTIHNTKQHDHYVTIYYDQGWNYRFWWIYL